MASVVDLVFKTLSPFIGTWTVLVQTLGDNVVDFVFKALVSIITSLGYVETLSSHSHASHAFSKRNASYWIVRVLSLADFGCRGLANFGG